MWFYENVSIIRYYDKICCEITVSGSRKVLDLKSASFRRKIFDIIFIVYIS